MKAIVCGNTVELPDLTDNQAVYDYVINHLRTQGEQSFTRRVGGKHPGSIKCLYRSTGKAGGPVCCAVGALIPDERYSEQFEETGMMPLDETFEEDYARTEMLHLAVAGPDLSKVGDSLWELLKDLQVLHDEYVGCDDPGDPDCFEFHAETIADDWDLGYTPPEEAA